MTAAAAVVVGPHAVVADAAVGAEDATTIDDTETVAAAAAAAASMDDSGDEDVAVEAPMPAAATADYEAVRYVLVPPTGWLVRSINSRAGTPCAVLYWSGSVWIVLNCIVVVGMRTS